MGLRLEGACRARAEEELNSDTTSPCYRGLSALVSRVGFGELPELGLDLRIKGSKPSNLSIGPYEGSRNLDVHRLAGLLRSVGIQNQLRFAGGC